MSTGWRVWIHKTLSATTKEAPSCGRWARKLVRWVNVCVRMEIIAVLIGTGVLLAVSVASFALLYEATAYALRLIAGLPGVRGLLSAQSSNGVDTFRISLGSFFGWNVAVNRRKRTVAGSIRIGSEKGWRVVGVAVALVAAVVVPSVSGLLIPAALVVVAIAAAGRPGVARARQEPVATNRRGGASAQVDGEG